MIHQGWDVYNEYSNDEIKKKYETYFSIARLCMLEPSVATEAQSFIIEKVREFSNYRTLEHYN